MASPGAVCQALEFVPKLNPMVSENTEQCNLKDLFNGRIVINGGVMSITSYLETLPLNKIAKYTAGAPKNGVPFTGYPRQHPSERDKFVLIYDPLGDNPRIIEFRIEDLIFMEDVHSAVAESGETAPLAKLWIRRGALGVLLEPFEADDPPHFANKTKELREHFLRSASR
jgi:hypothetical protein